MNDDTNKLIICSVVGVAISISVPCLIAGNPEYGVLVCLWASLCVGLYGILK